MGGGASSTKIKRRSGDSDNVVELMEDDAVDSAEILKLIDFDPCNKLDNFAKEMFLRSPKVEGLHHILSSQHGREAFMKFLRTE